MSRFRIDNIGGLARQMAHFTPQDTRAAQISSAEDLLHAIDPSKAYPFEFVVFKITGYHPKSPIDGKQSLLTGLALQHDLGLLIELASDSLNLHTSDAPEPVLTIEDACARFNVTSKTIQRWRRKGLPARRFVFADGKRRVGFLLSSVERFLSAQSAPSEREQVFSHVDAEEREAFLARARRLAASGRCCADDISRRIARKLGRSPLTVLHTIRRHDLENPRSTIFAGISQQIEPGERSRILRAYRRGSALMDLARQFSRPTATIYRLIVEERAARLARRRVKFYDDPLYHGEDAETVLATIASQDAIGQGVSDPAAERLPADLPPYLKSICAAPLLSPTRERGLFLQFNYRKMLFATARRRIDPQLARMRDLNRLELLWRRSIEVKNEIVRSNMRLVVSVARKHLRTGLSLAELVSDGTLTLMRAVEGFDVHRGHRFSTYATLALMKGFARSVPQMMSASRRNLGAPDELLSNIPDRRDGVSIDDISRRDEVGTLLSGLDPRERSVLAAHYGLDAGSPSTYEQVGAQLGLSKERVRQIEKSALRKLRAAAVHR